MEKLFSKTKQTITRMLSITMGLSVLFVGFVTIFALNIRIEQNIKTELTAAFNETVSGYKNNTLNDQVSNLQKNVVAQGMPTQTDETTQNYSTRIIGKEGRVEYSSDLFDRMVENTKMGFSRIEQSNVCAYTYSQQALDATGSSITVQVGRYCPLTKTDMMWISVAIVALSLLLTILMFMGARITAKRTIVPLQKAYNKTRTFVLHAYHELLTPLTVSLSQVQSALITKKYKSGLESVEKSLLDSVCSLENLQRSMEQEGLKEQEENLRIKSICNNLIAELQISGIEVGGDTSVVAPMSMVTIILKNLLSNANRYRVAASKIIINCQKQKITVQNEIAVPAIEVRRLGEIGYKGNTKDATSHGLGLRIAQDMAEYIGWKLTWRVKGKTFTVIIEV